MQFLPTIHSRLIMYLIIHLINGNSEVSDLVANIIASHAIARGSIPCVGIFSVTISKEEVLHEHSCIVTEAPRHLLIRTAIYMEDPKYVCLNCLCEPIRDLSTDSLLVNFRGLRRTTQSPRD